MRSDKPRRVKHSFIHHEDPDYTSKLHGTCRVCGGTRDTNKCEPWVVVDDQAPPPVFEPDEMISYQTSSPNLVATTLGNGVSRWHPVSQDSMLREDSPYWHVGGQHLVRRYRRHKLRFDPNVVLSAGLRKFLVGDMPMNVLTNFLPEMYRTKLVNRHAPAKTNLMEATLTGHGRAVARLLRLGRAPGPHKGPEVFPFTRPEATTDEVAILTAVRKMQKHSNRTATARGWHRDPHGNVETLDFPRQLLLMHGEISEAMEGDRRRIFDEKLPHRDAREVELADLMLRVMDVAEEMGFDIGTAFIEKNRYNLSRADHNEADRGQPGVKAY